jgi:hypothetical protein
MANHYIPDLTPHKSDRGWCLRTKDRDPVVNDGGFVEWFTSRAKAVEAIPRVRWDADNEWLFI